MVQHMKHPAKGVMRWYPVGKAQKALVPLTFGIAEYLDVYPVI